MGSLIYATSREGDPVLASLESLLTGWVTISWSEFQTAGGLPSPLVFLPDAEESIPGDPLPDKGHWTEVGPLPAKWGGKGYQVGLALSNSSLLGLASELACVAGGEEARLPPSNVEGRDDLRALLCCLEYDALSAEDLFGKDMTLRLGGSPSGGVVAYDTEVAIDFSGHSPTQLSVWHEGTYTICLTVSVPTKVGIRNFLVPRDELSADNLRDIFEHVSIAIGHNEKFDRNVLYSSYGVLVEDLVDSCHDSLGLKYCSNMNPTPPSMGGTGLGLKSLARAYLGADDWDAGVATEFATLKRKWLSDNKKFASGSLSQPPPYPTYEHLDRDRLHTYAKLDTYWTLRLFVQMLGRTSPGAVAYYCDFFLPMVEEVIKMERNGLYVDQEILTSSEGAYKRRAEKAKSLLAPHPFTRATEGSTGKEFNPRSTIFMSALVEVSGSASKSHKTSTGNWSCDKVAMAKLGNEDSEWGMKTPSEQYWSYMQVLKKCLHAYSSSIKPTLPYIVDGIVRPTFNVAVYNGRGTKTSRITTTSPATNIWLKDEPFQRALRAPIGCLTVKGDWRSQEPLVHAMLGGVQEWIDVYWRYKEDPADPMADLYKKFYGPVIGKHPEDVVGLVRSAAKVVLLAMIYDRHPTSLATSLGIPIEEALGIYEAFWALYPGLARRSNKIKGLFFKGELLRNPFGGQTIYTRDTPKKKADLVADFLSTSSVPMYKWADNSDISDLIEGNDVSTCRKVGNWEVQSTAWSLTASQMPAFRAFMTDRANSAGLHETVHDSYRGYFLEKYRDVVSSELAPYMEDLENGMLHGKDDQLLSSFGIRSLSEIPLSLEVLVGKDFYDVS